MAKPMQYFANMPPDQFVAEASKIIDGYYESLETTGVLGRWRRSFNVYYGSRPSEAGGTSFSSTDLKATGKQGELTYLNVNHFRNLVQHTLVLTTSQRPAFDCRATNSDYRSQTQAVLGSGILDYYMREKHLEHYLKNAVEQAIFLSEGHVLLEWDPNLGEPYGVDENGVVVREGDIKYSNPSALDVIRDPNPASFTDKDWVIVRTFRNKWDLAAKHPELAEKILSSGSEQDSRFRTNMGKEPAHSSQIPVFIFMHAKTESVPKGRLCMFVRPDVVLLDGALPYREIPLYTIMPSPIFGTPFGFTPAFDALPLQEAVNILSSTILSNQRTFGVSNIWAQPGAQVTKESLEGGMNIIYSVTKPEVIELVKTPPEIFDYRRQLIDEMETIFGINSVVRGNPEASIKAASALALVVSQAVQFSSGLQQANNTLLEGVGTGTLTLLRDYAKTKRVAAILGKNNRPFQKEFTGEDLSEVNRVIVDAGNALSKTTAGKVDMANALLQAGQVNGEQYIAVAKTGNLEPMIEGKQRQLLLIRSENENLKEGTPIIALITDHHMTHIQEHDTVLADPESRNDPDLVQRTLAHQQEHLELWRSMDPAMLMATGQQPPPPPPMPMMPPQGPGAPPPPSGPVEQPAPAPGPVPAEFNPKMPPLPPGSPPEAEAAFEQSMPA